ncbi:hypothetical protein SDC9_177061 [bioreactor metagenome]|uniref:DUF6363 domain-containing protein n=1 Tax=bioreactor metagenome TaxID=1076179 RepID=A0A645GRW6_9ZZZZ
MQPPKYGGAIRAIYRKHPYVADAMMNRYTVYNRTLEELEQLEREGKAFLVCPDAMPVTNRETGFKKLEASYRTGHAQGARDLPCWKEFLGLT